MALHALLVTASLPREDAGLSGPGLLNVDRAGGWHLLLPAQSRWQEVGQKALPAPLAGFLSSLPWSPHRTGFLLFGGQFCLYPDSRLFLAWGSTSGLLAWGRGPDRPTLCWSLRAGSLPPPRPQGTPFPGGLDGGAPRRAAQGPTDKSVRNRWRGARGVEAGAGRTASRAPRLFISRVPCARWFGVWATDRGGVDLRAGRGEGGARR